MGQDRFKFQHFLALLGALLTASLVKTGLLVGDLVPFNSDEAIVGLMARHILQGERPFFFYGQAYMGSLDAFLITGAFSFLGIHVWVIRLVQILLYLGVIVSTAFVAKRLTGSWEAGIFAGWILAIPSVNMTLYTTVSSGGYGEMLLIGNLILLTTYRILDRLDRDNANEDKWLWLVLGLFCGLGLWVFGLTLIYSLAAVFYLLWLFFSKKGLTWKTTASQSRSLQFTSSSLLVLGGVIGSAPWWFSAHHFGFQNLVGELSGTAIAGVEKANYLTQILQHNINLVLFGGSVLIGIRPPWMFRWLAMPLIPLILYIWVITGIFIYRTVRGGRRGKVANQQLNHPFLLVLVGFILLIGYVFSPFGADPSGRYFLPLYILFAIFCSALLVNIKSTKPVLSWGILGVILLFNLCSSLQVAGSYPSQWTTQFDASTRIDHHYDQELIRFLREKGEYYGYSNYWVSYPLAFRSNEEILFVPYLPYHPDFRYTRRDDRYPEYSELVRAQDHVAYITTKHAALDAYLRRRFSESRINWQEEQIGDYHVFYDLSRPVYPENIGLGETQ